MLHGEAARVADGVVVPRVIGVLEGVDELVIRYDVILMVAIDPEAIFADEVVLHVGRRTTKHAAAGSAA